MRRHTVRTRHPRYHVSQYDRGSGKAAAQTRASIVVRPENMKIVRDINQLTSGTFATLTGKTRYADLDKLREAFAEFVAGSPRRYDTWVEAYEHWQSQAKRLHRKESMEKKGYSLAYEWDTLEQANDHRALLKGSNYGIMKRNVYSGVAIARTPSGYAVYSKETKGYHNWLRTGRG